MFEYTVNPPKWLHCYASWQERLKVGMRLALSGTFKGGTAAGIALFHIAIASCAILVAFLILLINRGNWYPLLHRFILLRMQFVVRVLDYGYNLNNKFPPLRLDEHDYPTTLNCSIPSHIPVVRLFTRFLDGLPHVIVFFLYACFSWAIVPCLLGVGTYAAVNGWTCRQYAFFACHNYYIWSVYCYLFALTEDYPPAPWTQWQSFVLTAKKGGLPFDNNELRERQRECGSTKALSRKKHLSG